MKIGSAIKIARENLSLTATDLAKKTGVAPSTITRIEEDKVSPSLKVSQDIAKVLGLRLSQLVTIAEAIIEPENEIKQLQQKLLLSVQAIIAQG